jgi:GNAT superfamily N-acetyltransferase
MTGLLAFQPLSAQNFTDFVRLIRELAKYEKRQGPDAEAEARLKTDGVSNNPKYHAYLLEYEGVLIGYLIYFLTYSSFLARPTLHIEDLFILDEFRRRGFALQSFKFCAEKATALGCGRIDWTVLDWNTPAIQLYEKIGAQRLNWYLYRLERRQFSQI